MTCKITYDYRRWCVIEVTFFYILSFCVNINNFPQTGCAFVNKQNTYRRACVWSPKIHVLEMRKGRKTGFYGKKCPLVKSTNAVHECLKI